MSSSLLVVEGAHDASFFGHLLAQHEYHLVRRLSDLPDRWSDLIPRRYPVDDQQTLDHVIRIPEIYLHGGGNDVGIINAGGERSLVDALRVALDRLGADTFFAIGLVLDADHDVDVAHRFSDIRLQLEQLNAAAVTEGAAGYPIPLPVAPGVVIRGHPAVGVYVLPDNERQGTLETLLLECAAFDHPLAHRAASTMVKYLATRAGSHSATFGRLRSQAGGLKAQAGVIANILQPGTSLAVSLRRSKWLGSASMRCDAVVAADTFLKDLLVP